MTWGGANRPVTSNKLGFPTKAEGADGDLQIRQTQLGAKLFGKIGGRWYDSPFSIDGTTKVGTKLSDHLAITREGIEIYDRDVKVASFGRTMNIGNWNMNSTSIYTGTEDHSGYTANAGDITLYSDGSDSSIHAKYFRIDPDGKFYSTGGSLGSGTTFSGAAWDGVDIDTAQIADDAITAAKIGAGAVETAKLANDAVTAAIIAADAVGTSQLATGAVTSAIIAADAVGTSELATDAVTSAIIADDAVVTAAIANDAVTNALIATDAVNADSIVASGITATEIATDAVTANKIIADAITTAKIATGAITATEIASDAVTAVKIVAGAITTAKIAAGAITATEIASDAVTAVKIVSGAITTAKLDAGAVTADTIGANAITSAKIYANTIEAGDIKAGAITATTIATDAVTAGKIEASAVTTDKLDANAVTAAKITAGTITATEIDTASITADILDVGTVVVGEVGASKSNVQITGGAINLRTNTTNKVSLSSAGVLTMGDFEVASDGGMKISGKILTSAGSSNILIGTSQTDAGAYNIGIGSTTLQDVELGASSNIAIGYYAGRDITTGDYNVCVGRSAGYAINGAGSRNVCIGYTAGLTITTGIGNVVIGDVDVSVVDGDRQLAIGTNDGSTATTWITGDSSGHVTVSELNVTTLDCSGDLDIEGDILMKDEGWIGVSNTTERIIFDTAGSIEIQGADFGVNCDPSYKFDCVAPKDGTYVARFANSAGTTTSYGIIIQVGHADGATDEDYDGTALIRFNDGGGTAFGYIVGDDDGAPEYFYLSDERLKKDIVDTSFKGLDTINNVKLRDFTMKTDGRKVECGIIAQEIHEVFPKAGVKSKNQPNSDTGEMEHQEYLDDEYLWTASHGTLILPLVKAIQELSAKLDAMQEEINNLK